MPAPVDAVGLAEVFECLFAVKKDQLDLAGELRLFREDSGKFDQQAGARAAVIRSHKAKSLEYLCVIMGTKKKSRSRRSAKTGDQIHEARFATRCLIAKRLVGHDPA